MKRFLLAVAAAILVCLQISTGHAAAKTTTYTAKDGSWRISYPADTLSVEEKKGVVIFIGKGRRTFMAVDSFVAKGEMYGNTGENLRNRAQDVLKIVYDKKVQVDEVLSNVGAPWETGLTYSTDLKSKGYAYYQQRGRSAGDYRVFGIVYGYRASNEDNALPLLVAMRDSFKPIIISKAQDLAGAKAAVKGYLNALAEGRYDDAAALYGGSVEELHSWVPDAPADDVAAMLKQSCTTLVFQCLPVRAVDKGTATSAADWTFLVQFNNREGKLFSLQLPFEKAHTQFSFNVRKDGKRFTVNSLPLYVP